MRLLQCLCATIFFVCSVSAWAAPEVDGGTPRWHAARAFFDAGNYDSALKAFFSEAVPSHPAFYYNIGTTYLRLGKPGHALAYLEKANRLEPHDKEIRHNLLLAKTGLEATLGSDRLDIGSTPLEKIADRVPLNEVRATLGLLGLMLSILWTQTYWKTRRLPDALFRPGALFVGFAFLVTSGLFLATQLASARPPAIFIDRQVIRSGPGTRFVELGSAEAGMRIRLLGQRVKSTEGGETGAAGEVWHQIRYSSDGDGIGWVPASSLLLL